jgi:hypothetical protein
MKHRSNLPIYRFPTAAMSSPVVARFAEYTARTPQPHPRGFAAATVTLSAAAVVLTAIAVSPARAQVSCGDTVGPGGKVTLTADVGQCSGAGTPAVTIVGPVTVDLGGHQIRCSLSDPADGIRVTGDKARLLNGSVRNCGYGLRLEGSKHSVTGVTANSNEGAGIEVIADRVTLSRSFATSNGGDGIVVGSARNRIDHVVATNNVTGIVVSGGTNKISASEAVGNTADGFLISGAENQIASSFATSNNQSGFVISGSDNRFKECHSARNTQAGFEIGGDRNSLSACAASRNATDGFEVADMMTPPEGNVVTAAEAISNAAHGLEMAQGTRNDVAAGHFVNNGQTGIEFTSGTLNTFRDNVATENTGNDLKDSTACAGATWTGNSFGTSNDPCIQ